MLAKSLPKMAAQLSTCASGSVMVLLSPFEVVSAVLGGTKSCLFYEIIGSILFS